MKNQIILSHFVLLGCHIVDAFSSSAFPASSTPSPNKAQKHPPQPVGNILILDHLNINHEKGRHDWLKAFYFDFLSCVADPRKQENLQAGKKTVWANIGANQFHLPEAPDAQVLDGVVTLSYPCLDGIRKRLDKARTKLAGSKFDVLSEEGNCVSVSDPWGTRFRLVKGLDEERDSRGQQSGGASEGLAMRDLTIYTAAGSNMPGIGRFYDQVLGALILEQSADRCVVSVGPFQTLTFLLHPNGKTNVQHDDLRDDHVEPPSTEYPSFLSNYGPHISMYVADFRSCYRKAEELGIAYVNPRFKRRAYTLDQAIEDCMFRILDIKDPDAVDDGVILRLEHEVRSVVRRDGSLYKSCPFDDIPDTYRLPL